MPQTKGGHVGSTTNLQTTTAVNTTDTNDGLKPDAYYDRLLLKMLRQMDFEYSKYAVDKKLPRNYGDTVNWRRFLKLTPNTKPLDEGKTPDGRAVSGTSLTAVVQQYGDVMYFTDIVDKMQLDDVKQEYTVELGYLAKETLDYIVRNVLVAEGSAYFAGDDNSELDDLGPNDVPKIDDFRKIVLGMKRAYLKGNRKANGKYVALVSPEVMFDLFDDERMENYMNFGQTNKPFADGMVVDMFGLRFVEVLNAPFIDFSTESDDILAYDSIVIGEEAYAITKLEGAGVKIITKGLGSAGVEDPLDQRQSIGWKITGFTAKVLNNESVVNYWSVPGAAKAALEDADDDLNHVVFVPLSKKKGLVVKNSVVEFYNEKTTYNHAIDAAEIKSDSGTIKYYEDREKNTEISDLASTIDSTDNVIVYVEVD